MKLKTGDLVRFVDEAIEGHVTSFQENDIIGVTDDSGFEIPVPASKVTLVHGDMHTAEDREDNLSTVDSQAPFAHEGVYFAVAGDSKQGLASFFIVNETSYDLLVAISHTNANGKVSGVYAGIIAPKSSQNFYSANFSHVGKWPAFQIQLLKYTPSSEPAQSPLSKQIRFKPLDLSRAKTKLDVLDEKAWTQQIDKPEDDLKLERLSRLGKLR